MSSNQQTSIETSNRRSVDVQKRRIPREVRFGVYVLGSTLGEGEFGKVKLGWRKDGKNPSQAAIKLIKRESIPRGSEKENKIHREINALKRLRHPNIVRLVEVLQNDKYIGIVLEYASGGELFDYILEHRYLKESMACRLFAQLVSGVDYMHSKGIVHRDLKLENLLLDKHKNIIITDFGFVNSFHSNDLMKTSCGSPCYAAPELVVSSEPYEGQKVDVWSCGIILYAMLAGYLPFDDDPQNPDGNNIARLYHYITHTALTFPEYIQPTPRDLLRKIIVSDPKKRISLKDIRSHQWLAPHAPFLSVTPSEWDMNYRSSKQLVSQQEKINRRMSLMENPTSASFMLKRPNIKSYSTHNVAASLYSNPAAPQTSHTVAVPSAETSPISSANNKTPIKKSPVDPHEKGHTRSNSSASIALQAVVEADKFEISKRYSIGNDPLPKNPLPRAVTYKPMFPESVPTSASSTQTSFEPITESPESKKMPPPPIPSFSKPQSSNSNNTKLPSSRSNRPRPTSYHPASSSSAMLFSTPDFSFMTATNSSETSLSRNKVINNQSYSSTIESLTSSPVKEKRKSWCQPKISEPALDMSIANGVLTQLNDIATSSTTSSLIQNAPSSMINNNNSDNNDAITNTNTYIKEETSSQPSKCNSIALDSLSNAIDLLSVSSKSNNNIPKLSQDGFNKNTESNNNKLRESENNVPESSIINPIPFNNATKTQIYKESIPHPSSAPSNKIAESQPRSTSSSKGITTPPPPPQRRVSSAGTNSSEKENSNNSSGSNIKYKRFSLLNFYQHEPTSRNVSNSSLPSQKAHIPNTSTNTNTNTNIPISKQSTKYHSYSTVSSNANSNSNALNTSSRKPLEPANVRHDRRTSVSVSSTNKNINNNDKDKEKEPSTARRVMDFFKRRSMRI